MEKTSTNLQEIIPKPRESLGNVSDTCEICRGIWSCFMDPTTPREVSLGYTDELAPPRCPGHSPLFIHWRDHCQAEPPDAAFAIYTEEEEDSSSEDGANTEALETATRADEINKMSVRTLTSYGMVTLTRRFSPRGEEARHVIMLKQDWVPGHPGIGIRLDPDWIDLQLAREWKRKCLEEHGMKCKNPYKVSPVRPDWVVDVETGCIVPGRDCAAFIALSYRWGDHSWPRVDWEMLRAIRKPGALATVCLAPIIRHAMSLTSAIGERFLWVDALCIIQEDTHQLNLMGAFYANALVTIVAADGDAVTGILGIKGVSNTRKAKQTMIPFGGETLICPDFKIHLGDYETRGWTYQEYVMSQRRLIFAGNRMHWVCQCCNWHEEAVFRSEFNRRFLDQEPKPTPILRGLPDINSLSNVVADYNSRNFSYEEDIIPGISGLLSLFSRSFQGGFLCGLPEMFFDKALGWCASSNMRRRKPSGRPGKHQLPHSLAILPSWSWAGWEGRISDQPMEVEEAIEAWNRNIYNCDQEETTPITDWFTSHSADGAALRKISPIWFKNRDARYKDFARSLPEGWTRKEPGSFETDGPGRWRPPGCHDYLFQHCLFPDSLWYFPFPITEVQESTPQSTPEQTPYLFCKTYKAHLWATCSVEMWEYTETKSPYYGTGTAVAKNLRVLEIRTERRGPRIGELYLHNTDQLAPFLLASGDDLKTGPGHSVELVSIYRSTVCERRFQVEVISERYRVLWVEWENGIAYRLGVGWVEKTAWEGVNRTEIDLVLG